MESIKELLKNNSAWAHALTQKDPQFFSRLSGQQSPKYLWIGCSDSRVPANQIVGLVPGEIFVHRNVANLVVHTDLNCLSVLQFAVEVLQVEHVIICGHYGCGGVEAAYHERKLGLVSNWLMHIQDVKNKYRSSLNNIEGDLLRIAKLCELNVLEQVINVCQTTVMQAAWDKGQNTSVHGWIYGLNDGLIKDLKADVSSNVGMEEILEAAITNLGVSR